MKLNTGDCAECGKTVPNANVCPHCNHRHSEEWKQSNDTIYGISAILTFILFYIIIY